MVALRSRNCTLGAGSLYGRVLWRAMGSQVRCTITPGRSFACLQTGIAAQRPRSQGIDELFTPC